MVRFLKSNVITLIWLTVYTLLFFFLFYDIDIRYFWYMVLLGVISMLVALSPVGEAIMRLLCGARKIRTQQETEYLIPIFEEVYTEIRGKEHISENIKLYIDESPTVNAYALGCNTIAVTRGAIETVSDSELKGMFAHEFGHLRNGDTKLLMLLTIGSGVFGIILFICKFIANFISIFLRELSKDEGSMFVFPIYLIFSLFKGIFYIVVWVILFVVQIILQASSRRNEYHADKFAFEMGYGGELIEVLYKLNQMTMGGKISIMDRIKASHPNIPNRIERLENME